MSNSLFLKVQSWLRENVPVEREDLAKIQHAIITLDLDEEFLEMAEEGEISSLPLKGFSFKMCFYIKKALKYVKKGW